MKKYAYAVFTVLYIISFGAVSEEMLANKPTLYDYSIGEKWVWKFKGVASDGATRANGIDEKEIVSIESQLFLKSGDSKTSLSSIINSEESNTPRYSWPLKVGKKWVFKESWTSQDGTTGQSTFNAEVVAFKMETVEAGSFMAYTIKYEGTVSNSRGYNAKTSETIVYAPAVKQFIRLTQIQDGYLYNEELIEYSAP